MILDQRLQEGSKITTQAFRSGKRPLVEIRPFPQAKAAQEVIAIQPGSLLEERDASGGVGLSRRLAEQGPELGHVQHDLCLRVQIHGFMFRDDPALADELCHLPERMAQIPQRLGRLIIAPEQDRKRFARISLTGMFQITDGQISQQGNHRAAAGCDGHMVELELWDTEELYRQMHKDTLLRPYTF